jgi:regulator of sigma E protease
MLLPMLAFAHGALTWILPFLFVLTIVITVHELGHFLVARACGVAIERFSIGFGRALLKWRDRSGVEWRIGWIPLGGYVMFAGDENAASVPDSRDLAEMRREIIAREGPAGLPKYLYFKPLWQRAAVAAAGPMANFLLSIVLLSIFLMAIGETTHRARIAGVAPDSAAATAGFQVGDLVTRADDRPVVSFEQLHEIVALRAEVPMRFTVQRGGRDVVIAVTPRRVKVEDPISGSMSVGQLGLAPSLDPHDAVRMRYDPISAVGGGVARTWDMISTTVYSIGRLVRGQESPRQLTGVLGIARISHFAAAEGARGEPNLIDKILGSAVTLLSLVAVISVNIGFVNLLPIPVLDGGHLLFYAYEAVARRPVAAAVQAASYRLGLALLLGLMLFAITNDLQRSGVLHFLGGPFS